MPEWLMNNGNYIPPNDKDTFIDKSIISLLKGLSRIKRRNRYSYGRFGANSISKIVTALLTILLLSFSKNIIFALTIAVIQLVNISLLKAEDIVRVLKVAMAAAVFTLAVLLPSILYGNHNGYMIVIKVFASVTAVNILSCTTDWNSVTVALKRLMVPGIFILVLDIAIKYILLLGEFSLNMFYSIRLRSVGKNKNKDTALSGVAGTMFIKSKEMAEDMYAAMECRCFTGEYEIRERLKLKTGDLIHAAAGVSMIFIFFFLERL